MNILNVNFESKESILQSFDSIAKKFSDSVQLKINKASYLITDFEFYTLADQMKDPYTHKDSLQLQNGKMYSHGSGIDITFGDGKNYGGILIRGIVRLSNSNGNDEIKQFQGPHVVATEIFSNINSLFSDQPNDIALIETDSTAINRNNVLVLRTIKTKRVNLTQNTEDLDGFYLNLPFRYIIILRSTSTFKHEIKGVESLLQEEISAGRIKKEEAIKILGYNKIFV